MPAIRHDHLFATRLNRWYRLVAAATVICLFFVVKDLVLGQIADLWIPLLCLAPVLVICFIGKHRILSGFRCQACGERLPLPKRKPDGTLAIHYYCRDCDIVWETGVRDDED